MDLLRSPGKLIKLLRVSRCLNHAPVADDVVAFLITNERQPWSGAILRRSQICAIVERPLQIPPSPRSG